MIRMNQKTRDKLFIILIVAVICFMIFTIWYLISNKQAFIENPFVYGAKELGNINCACNQKLNDGSFAYFSFNDSAFVSGDKIINVRRKC